jgi:ABC-type transport system involved in multi-copper enzyme maturation permease subunit
MLLWTTLVILGYTSIGLVVFPVVQDLLASGEMAAMPAQVAGEDVWAQAGITEINWDAAMRFIPMGVSGAWGVMLLSLITAYVFGRELREGTDIASATLPVRREYFVIAKMVVIAVWAAALGLLAVVTQVALDVFMLGLDGFAWSYVWRALGETLAAMLPLYLTLPVVAWLSLTRKGYLRPMIFATVMFMIASSLIGLDAAAYFPWSMPIVMVGVTWMPLKGELTALSWLIAVGVFVVGALFVMRTVNRAESMA